LIIKNNSGLDGWISISEASIYAFILILPFRKEYIYSLKDLFIYSHTAKFIFKKILKIINAIRPNKISSIILDNASIIVKVKQIVNDEYNHIISISCIAHHVNLLTTDIIKHEYSKEIIMKYMKIIKFFYHSY